MSSTHDIKFLQFTQQISDYFTQILWFHVDVPASVGMRDAVFATRQRSKHVSATLLLG